MACSTCPLALWCCRPSTLFPLLSKYLLSVGGGWWGSMLSPHCWCNQCVELQLSRPSIIFIRAEELLISSRSCFVFWSAYLLCFFAVTYWFDKEFLYLAFRSHVPFPESWGHNCRFYFPIIRPHIHQNLNKHIGDIFLVRFKHFFWGSVRTTFIGFGKVWIFLRRKTLCK